LRPAHDGFARIRIHDLKHTFGRRLRAAGVTEEDRKALLGHRNSIIYHYSAAELDQLIAAANKVSATDSRAPALTLLKGGKHKENARVARKVAMAETTKPLESG
jgi:hypothetical protein